jgi:hypothetical protein
LEALEMQILSIRSLSNNVLNHPDNPALKGSSTAEGAGVQKTCTFEEDLAVSIGSFSIDVVSEHKKH